MIQLRRIALFAVLLILTSCWPNVSNAQGFDDDVDDMPLDGGATLLAAGGFAYMIRKAAEAKKAKQKGYDIE